MAWKVLLHNEVSSLPVDVFDICKREKIQVFTYTTGKDYIETANLSEHIIENDAIAVDSIIFYDNTKPIERCRFSIAHELGHLFLHTNRKVPYFNREPFTSLDDIEREADLFAARLLAPLAVLQMIGVNSASEISKICGISYTAAKIRYNRLCEIRKRNKERRINKNHGTFFLSRDERKLCENFADFIRENKREFIKDVEKQDSSL
jgi:Zn-dependent peptidase ImmA (M78 family)